MTDKPIKRVYRLEPLYSGDYLLKLVDGGRTDNLCIVADEEGARVALENLLRPIIELDMEVDHAFHPGRSSGTV